MSVFSWDFEQTSKKVMTLFIYFKMFSDISLNIKLPFWLFQNSICVKMSASGNKTSSKNLSGASSYACDFPIEQVWKELNKGMPDGAVSDECV